MHQSTRGQLKVMILFGVVVCCVHKVVEESTPVPDSDLSLAEAPEMHLYPEDLLDKGCLTVLSQHPPSLHACMLPKILS